MKLTSQMPSSTSLIPSFWPASTEEMLIFLRCMSTQGVANYSGPCTPPGSPHHYTFKIIATDLDPKELPPGLTLPELEAKLAGHTKGAAGLVGLFVKPQ